MKSKLTKENFEFNLREDNDFRDLLSDLSSAHSASISYSFEYSDDLHIDSFGLNEIKRRREQRTNLIPQTVRNLAKTFVTDLFANFLENEKDIMNRMLTREHVNSNLNTNYTNFLRSTTNVGYENKSSRDFHLNNRVNI